MVYGTNAGPDAEDEADATAKASFAADELFHGLEPSRRRVVIWYLHGREAPVWMRAPDVLP